MLALSPRMLELPNVQTHGGQFIVSAAAGSNKGFVDCIIFSDFFPPAFSGFNHMARRLRYNPKG